MKIVRTAITIDEDPSCELDGELLARWCTEDENYPLSLEGETEGGYSIAISVTDTDAYNLFLKLKEIYGD